MRIREVASTIGLKSLTSITTSITTMATEAIARPTATGYKVSIKTAIDLVIVSQPLKLLKFSDIVELVCPANGEVKGEFKTKRDGKSTIYNADGKVMNQVYNEGVQISSEEVLKPADAWFGDGLPFVVDPNHHH